jgi:hypothetical protein
MDGVDRDRAALIRAVLDDVEDADELEDLLLRAVGLAAGLVRIGAEHRHTTPLEFVRTYADYCDQRRDEVADEDGLAHAIANARVVALLELSIADEVSDESFDSLRVDGAT